MISSKEVFNYIRTTLKADGPGEAEAIAFLVMHQLFAITKVQLLSDIPIDFDSNKKKLEEIISRANLSEPVQYILGETEFYGRHFKVNPSVLIPRPETEELVDTCIKDIQHLDHLLLLDFCTGSGCIATTLACALKGSEVFATDISEEAIRTASENALINKANVTFIKHDLRDAAFPLSIKADVIISNPPYVMRSEATLMNKNVLNYEPHLALFVEDDDPLVFYRHLLRHAETLLKKGGRCYLEINEKKGHDICQLLKAKGFSEIVVLKDINGKDRFVKGLGR